MRAPGSTISQLFEPLFVKTKEVRNFVDHGDFNFLLDLIDGIAYSFNRFLEHKNCIGKHRGLDGGAVGERHTVVETQKRIIRFHTHFFKKFGRGTFLHRDHDVLEILTKFRGYPFDRACRNRIELLLR